jgi:hypothetical protein
LKEQNDIEGNEQDNVFSNNACLSQFEVFASDQPLNSPEMESKFGNITTQFNDNSPWISAKKSSETGKSSGIGDNEPWELEDNGEEIITPVPTTNRLSAFNNDFFSDSFNPSIIAEIDSNANKENDDGHFTKQISNEDIDQSFAKSVRFDDNVQKIRAPTPQKDILNESKSSTTSDSNEVEIDDITPSFETISDRITDHMETSFVNVDTTDVKVYISFLILINEVSILFSDGTST